MKVRGVQLPSQPQMANTKFSRIFAALDRVHHFGMELHAVDPAVQLGDCGDMSVVGAGDDVEIRRRRLEFVAVTHPDRHALRQVAEQGRVARRTDPRVAVLPGSGVGDLAFVVMPHELQAVADPEDRLARLEYARIRVRRVFPVHAGRTARQDDAGDVARREFGRRRIVGQHLAIDVAFPNAPRDELRVLRAEIEDGNPVRVSHLMDFRWMKDGCRQINVQVR